MTDRLRVAVVGAGHLGAIHARLLTQVEGVQVVAVVDPDIAVCHRVATSCGARPLPNHRSLLGLVDAAVIAAPTSLHHTVTLDLLNAGVHVLVEKPLVARLVEADQLLAVAQRQRRVLQVGHVERFNPAWQVALPHLHQPRYLEIARHSGYSFRSTDIGVVMDLMIHDLDLVLSVVDSPLVNVQALGMTVMGTHEDIAHARLEFANGCLAHLSASRVSTEGRRAWQVHSADSHVRIDLAEHKVQIVRPTAKLMEQTFEPNRLTSDEKSYWKDRLFDELLRVENPTVAPANALLDEQRDFVRAIRTAQPPRVTGADGRRALEAAERVLAAMNQQAHVPAAASGHRLRRAG